MTSFTNNKPQRPSSKHARVDGWEEGWRQGSEEEAIRGMKTRRMEREVKKGGGVMIEETWCQGDDWRKGSLSVCVCRGAMMM